MVCGFKKTLPLPPLVGRIHETVCMYVVWRSAIFTAAADRVWAVVWFGGFVEKQVLVFVCVVRLALGVVQGAGMGFEKRLKF